MLTSNDGTSWTAVTGTIFLGSGTGVTYGSGLWVAVGSDGGGIGGGGNTILTSNNGTTWSPATGTVFTGNGVDVSYGNGNWVAVGSDTSGVGGGGNTILGSSNGTNWTTVSGTIFTNIGYGVAYGNGLWVAVGSDSSGGGGGNTILTSGNGTNWAPLVTGTIFTGTGFGVAYGNGIWVAMGSGTDTMLYTLKLPCFLEGSKIFTEKGYVPIEDIRKGDKVKTVLNGFVPVDAIGFREINHSCSSERIGEQLYVCSANNYPELTEDLVITGHHSVLVKNFSSQEQREATEKALGKIYVTDKHYRLPACVDSRTTVYPVEGKFKVYHLALENNDYYMNYGIYANGLLVESTSKRYLLELSGMELI